MKRPWTEEEISFIHQHWGRLDDAGLASELRRPMSSVADVRLKLGLRRPRPAGQNNKYVASSPNGTRTDGSAKART